MNADIVTIVEAAYRVEASEDDWLRGIVDAARPSLERGLGVSAYLYDASNPTQMRAWGVTTAGPAPLEPGELAALVGKADPEYAKASWQTVLCAIASEIPGFDKNVEALKVMHAAGVHDFLAINGVDPTGIGVWLGAALPKVTKLGARRRTSWTRVAAHLASAFRVRRALAKAADATKGAEAILDRRGRVEHAVSDAAAQDARETLREAVRAYDRVRRMKPGEDREDAMQSWRAMVEARWTLVDHFESDGREFVLARRNEAVEHRTGVLTARELQVVAFAALGHSDKVVAFELGIASSTARVLLARAKAKLGAKSREEAIEIYLRTFGS